MTGYTVYMSPRALIALMCQSNTLDLKRWGPSYELRLAKYAERGFEVHIPFLDREKVDYGRVSSSQSLCDDPFGNRCYTYAILDTTTDLRPESHSPAEGSGTPARVGVVGIHA